MNLLQVVVMAVVEGITEYLPISSTGHLVLLARLMGVVATTSVTTFEIAIQLGAILAIVTLYTKRVMRNWAVVWRIGVAFLPTMIVGVLLYPIVKNNFLGNQNLVVDMLFLGGVVMVWWEKFKKPKDLTIEKLSWWQCVLVGLGQSVSLIPGVSRAMATIVSGMGVGLSRSEAVEMAFLLAVPTMAAAVGLDLVKSASGLNGSDLANLGIGLVIAYVVAIVSVKWLLGYVKKHDLTIFGWYRIGLALLWWLAATQGII